MTSIGSMHGVDEAYTPRMLDCDDGRYVRTKGLGLVRMYPISAQTVRRRRRARRWEYMRLALAVAVGAMAAVAAR